MKEKVKENPKRKIKSFNVSKKKKKQLIVYNSTQNVFEALKVFHQFKKRRRNFLVGGRCWLTPALCGRRAREPGEGMKARKTLRVGTWTPTSDMLHQLDLLPLVANMWGGASNQCGAQEMMHRRGGTRSLGTQIINHRGALRKRKKEPFIMPVRPACGKLFIYLSGRFTCSPSLELLF